jgi:DNA-binding SARP family transcriptional activator
VTLEEPTLVQLTSPSDLTTAPIQTSTLTAHLLGTFSISVNDQPVENWPSGRGRAVFKYLLIHHNQPTSRDVLMDVFWQDASPEAARNRLHVALHSIRQRLRAATDMPVVIFEDGAYGLNPDFHLWVDVDEFDRHVEKGRRLETAGQIAKAVAEYEPAISLYQGDLLADDPYEEWPVLARERLRVAYLDTLDRLSHIYFDRGEYAACVTLCQLVLARDNCREDAHCLLMGCYSRQDQHHLALRQYQACVEALRTELDVAPAPTTTQLYERIRRRERV